MENSLSIHTGFEEIDPAQWSQLLEASDYASTFQSREMYLFWKKQINHEPFVVAVGKESKILGLCTGVIMYNGTGLKQRLTRRAIINSGPLLSKDSDQNKVLVILLKEIDKLLKPLAIYAEVRNFLDYGELKSVYADANWVYKPHLNFHLDCSNEAEAVARLNKDKKRQINKSLKAGAKIIEPVSLDQVEAFYAILLHLYKTRVKTPLPDFSFFRSFFESSLGKYLLVEYEGKIVGGIMCPILENKIIYNWYVCGMDREIKKVHPSILATWAAIAYGAENQIACFDFMGAGKPDEDYGVRDFKAQFGGQLVEHGRFFKVYQALYYKIGQQAVKMIKGKK